MSLEAATGTSGSGDLCGGVGGNTKPDSLDLQRCKVLVMTIQSLQKIFNMLLLIAMQLHYNKT